MTCYMKEDYRYKRFPVAWYKKLINKIFPKCFKKDCSPGFQMAKMWESVEKVKCDYCGRFTDIFWKDEDLPNWGTAEYPKLVVVKLDKGAYDKETDVAFFDSPAYDMCSDCFEKFIPKHGAYVKYPEDDPANKEFLDEQLIETIKELRSNGTIK